MVLRENKEQLKERFTKEVKLTELEERIKSQIKDIAMYKGFIKNNNDSLDRYLIEWMELTKNEE